jgi:16S rRNA (cytosine1402-N4)-methyltransferase
MISRLSDAIAGGARTCAATEALDWVPDVADNRPEHLPVLATEVVGLFSSTLQESAEGWIVDATVGAGGHAALLLERFPRIQVLGLDQDPDALSLAGQRLAPFGARARLEHARFTDLQAHLRTLHIPRPVGLLCDLGASSMQLDRPERGFSFQEDGPLDMRMDPTRDRTAAAIVNGWDESDLADLFFYEGGERHARRIAREIVSERRRAPFRRTLALADLIERIVPGGRGSGGARLHAATKTFQALRRAVNEEGEELRALLSAAQTCLADHAVFVSIAFHSGEDGEVKRWLRQGAETGRWRILTKKPLSASSEEERANPRARSARVRAAERTRCPDEVNGGSTGPTLDGGSHRGDEGGGRS